MKYMEDSCVGKKALFNVEHFKNRATKGSQLLPLSKDSLKVVALLERAAAWKQQQLRRKGLGQVVTTLFYKGNGAPFPEGYFGTKFSTIMVDLLDCHCTANSFRHLFTTNFRDLVASPTTRLTRLRREELEEFAAGFMLNSTEVMAAAYDDSSMDRELPEVISMWPKFLAHLEHQHDIDTTEKAWDPLKAKLADIS